MRKVALAVCLTTLAACGSSSTSKGLNVAPTMTVGGVAFVPSDGGGLAVSNKSCVLPTVGSLYVSALAVGFSSYGGLCDFVKKNTMCATKQSSKMGSVIVARAGSAAPGPIGPGTYTIGVTGDASGFTIASVEFDEEDATCQSTSPVAGATGTVTITAVSPSVKGSVAATLLDGSGATVGTVSGNFDVGTCDYQVDICTMMSDTGCGTTTCIP